MISFIQFYHTFLFFSSVCVLQLISLCFSQLLLLHADMIYVLFHFFVLLLLFFLLLKALLWFYASSIHFLVGSLLLLIFLFLHQFLLFSAAIFLFFAFDYPVPNIFLDNMLCFLFNIDSCSIISLIYSFLIISNFVISSHLYSI